MIKLEPIIGKTLHDLAYHTRIYALSGFRLNVKRVHGWWVLTPIIQA